MRLRDLVADVIVVLLLMIIAVVIALAVTGCKSGYRFPVQTSGPDIDPRHAAEVFYDIDPIEPPMLTRFKQMATSYVAPPPPLMTNKPIMVAAVTNNNQFIELSGERVNLLDTRNTNRMVGKFGTNVINWEFEATPSRFVDVDAVCVMFLDTNAMVQKIAEYPQYLSHLQP